MNQASDVAALGAYGAALDASALTPDLLQAAKACLLYGLAVGVGTRRAAPALMALEAARLDERSGGAAAGGAAAGGAIAGADTASAATSGGGAVTRLLDGARVSLGNAAFANAVLMSGRVQGDSHKCGHLGGVVIPAALAATEHAGGSGADLLSAMLAGYEVSLRIGRDHAADLSTRGFRSTPCYGVFAAAAAAARVRGYGAQRMTHAINLSVNFAAGLREYVDAGTGESPFHAGFAARNGLHAADLVGLGLDATPTALFGDAGFYQAYAGNRETDYGARIAQGLGEDFEFTKLTFKPYPACQFLRGMIRGVAALSEQADGQAPRRIELRMNPFEADFIGVRFTGPFVSAPQTVMSAPFCAALAWVHRTVGYDALRVYDDARVNALVSRVDVVADPQRARYEPAITVTLEDGRVLRWAGTDGDASYRITWESASRMTYALCAEVDVAEHHATTLIERVDAIDRAAGVAPLIDAITAAMRG
jgi:2-methylcitrate dehydratase PrpD